MSDRSQWTHALIRSMSLGVDEWRLDAELVGVQVVGATAVGPPGVLRSPVAFAQRIRAGLLQADVPPALAGALADGIWMSWKQWADGVRIPSLPWYPAFAAWPSPVAPPTPNVPTPLALCVSSGLAAMSGPVLARTITARLEAAAGPDAGAGAEEDIRRLAAAVSAAFQTWVAMATVTMALGAGRAAVAPPFVPVRPVLGSVVHSRGCLAAAPPFPQAVYVPVP
jgi:hypothetical protein